MDALKERSEEVILWYRQVKEHDDDKLRSNDIVVFTKNAFSIISISTDKRYDLTFTMHVSVYPYDEKAGKHLWGFLVYGKDVGYTDEIQIIKKWNVKEGACRYIDLSGFFNLIQEREIEAGKLRSNALQNNHGCLRPQPPGITPQNSEPHYMQNAPRPKDTPTRNGVYAGSLYVRRTDSSLPAGVCHPFPNLRAPGHPP